MELKKAREEKPLRIALVMGKYVTGGIKSVIMSYYQNINRKEVQFDFIIDNDSPLKDYSEILTLGGRIYEIPPVNQPLKNILTTRKILKEHNYIVVHGYINTLNVIPMFAAFLAGTPIRIAENLSTAHIGEKKTILKKVLKPFSMIFPTHIAANSKYAAEWLYGKRNLVRCRIIHNALDLEKFKIDTDLRVKMRAKLGITNCFVVGHVGRYSYQKNHKFLIEIFNAIYKKDTSARFILVGYGELKDQIWKLIYKYGLDKVVFDCGATEDTVPLYNAMDCFVLPSFYEGLPVVGIEAQATGLPCVISTKVTSETAITNITDFISLERSADYWANCILKWKTYKRIDVRKQITENGYNIKDEAHKLEKYYFKCIESKKSKIVVKESK